MSSHPGLPRQFFLPANQDSNDGDIDDDAIDNSSDRTLAMKLHFRRKDDCNYGHLEGLNQSLLVYEPSPGNVDDIDRRIHFC